MFRFDYVVYPLWRRQMPGWARPLAEAILPLHYPVNADRQPPADSATMARFLHEWGLIPETPATLTCALDEAAPHLEDVAPDAMPRPYEGPPVHLPAQWAPQESVLISWPIVYPPVWAMAAEMVAAIAPVARVDILVPSALWARAVWTYLASRGGVDLKRVRLLALPTNDIWIRDYGPQIGRAPNGERVVLHTVYDPIPEYPQQDDNRAPYRWAAHRGLPLLELPFHNEGGNLLSDGAGTLFMSEQIFHRNPYYDRESLLSALRRFLALDKLIITPRLTLEDTGHIDLAVKLASADTVLVSAATSPSTSEALRKTRRLFERERNAAGQNYAVYDLPTPPFYYNWLHWKVRRSYTNSLTVNGRVLVPIFGLPDDEVALRTYERALPDHAIIPIDAANVVSGGGAIHCMTREIPGA